MNTVLFISFMLLLVAIVVLIFLDYRLDRAALRIDMRWRTVRSLLCALATETLESETIQSEEREKIEAFIKSKRQKKQVACANELKSLLTMSEADARDLAERCQYYNEDVQQFNQTLERPLWRFVAAVFRVKPRIMVDLADAD